jgi:hypothetical protein
LLVCDCERRWTAQAHWHFNGKLRQTPQGYYRCARREVELISPNCPRTIGARKADEIAWNKFIEAFESKLLWAAVQLRIAELREKAESVLAEEAKLNGQLDILQNERQNVILLARKKLITDKDLSYQLSEIDLRALHLRRELADCQKVIALSALDNWEEHARTYLEEVRVGIEVINAAAPDDSDLFARKREMMTTFVEKVHIDRERNIVVTLRLDILALAGQAEAVKCLTAG